jgi:protein TonB
MHALEDDPEQKGRWKRMMTGVVIAVGLAAAALFTAQSVVPVQRLMPEILQMAVVDDTPPPQQKELPPPPPPPPPPPKPKHQDEPKEKPVEQEKAPEEKAPEPEPAEAAAGLDASSFGSGSGTGMSFRTGTTQMGDPNKLIRKAVEIAQPKPIKGAKLTPARALDPVLPDYPERARKLNIQGSVFIEADIDERGKLTAVRVRQGLEKGLDEIAMASVRGWRFQPASLGGRSVASTRLVRIRFELD